MGATAKDEKVPDYLVFRSPDGGRTWEEPAYLGHARFYDRAYLVVDHGATPYHGRLYVMGVSFRSEYFTGDTRDDEMALFTSDDSGRTFHGPATAPTGARSWIDFTRPPPDFNHPGPSRVLADGTLVTGFTVLRYDSAATGRPLEEQSHRYQFKVTRSRDGGRTLDPPVVVGSGRWVDGPGDHIPAIAADTTHGPFRNRAYVVWIDGTHGRMEIDFSASDDAGASWSPPRLISDNVPADPAVPEAGPHNHTVSMIVNKNGVIGVSYYAQRTPLTGEWPVFTASFDGGLTWTAPERVTPFALFGDPRWIVERDSTGGGVAPLRVNFGPPYRGSANDTGGLTTGATGDFHIFPVATHATGSPELGMVTARPSGPAVKRREVTAEVRAELRTVTFDSVGRTVAVAVTLTNQSRADFPLPILVAVDGVPAANGVQKPDPNGDRAGPAQRINALNADNHRRTTGAVWLFHGVKQRHLLRPGERTAARILRFALTDNPPASGLPEIVGGTQTRFDMRAYVGEELNVVALRALGGDHPGRRTHIR